jgi:hypothetical protein
MILIKKIKKTGQNRAITGQVPHFGPFPLKKRKRGAKMGRKPCSINPISSIQTISHHKRSTPVVF